MAEYQIVDVEGEVSDDDKQIEKTEETTSVSRVTVGQLKQRCEQIDGDIQRLVDEKQGVIDELNAINDSKAVKVSDIPVAISVTPVKVIKS